MTDGGSRTKSLALASTAAHTDDFGSASLPVVDENIERQISARDEIRGIGAERDNTAIATDGGNAAGIIPFRAIAAYTDTCSDPGRMRQRAPWTEQAYSQKQRYAHQQEPPHHIMFSKVFSSLHIFSFGDTR